MRPTQVHQFPQHHSDKMGSTGLGWVGGLLILVFALMAISFLLDWTFNHVRPAVAEKVAEAARAADAGTLAHIQPR